MSDDSPTPVDPGWWPAARLAAGLLRDAPGAPVLISLRATTLLLSAVGGGSGLAAIVLGAGSSEPRVDAVVGQVGLSTGVIVAAMVMAMTGRVLPDEGPRHLAAFLFTTTQRKVLAAAAVGPLGLFLSWLAGDGTLVIFGVGASLLLIAVASPTAVRIRAWQDEVDEFAEPFSVLDALLLPSGR